MAHFDSSRPCACKRVCRNLNKLIEHAVILQKDLESLLKSDRKLGNFSGSANALEEA